MDMKSREEIEEEIGDCEIRLAECELEHKSFNQIIMLSGEGSMLRERINKYKGKIEALKWVIS
jgi:hypothetical protein